MRLSALWSSQPSVESVVGYLVRQYVQVPIVLKEIDPLTGIIGDQDYTHPAAQSIRQPGIDYGDATWRMRMALDYYVYRNAYSIIIKPPGSDTAVLQHIPAYAMGVWGRQRLIVERYQIIFADGSAKELDPSEVIHWRGPNSADPKFGWSQLEQIRDVLIDEATTRAQNIEFNRSGRVKGGVVERPVEAPELNQAGRERMGQSYSDELKRLNEGGVLVIDEGGKWVDIGVTPREAEAVAAAAANFAAICNIYGVNPNLLRGLGLDQTAAREPLFTDILPGDSALLLEAINRTLIQGTFDEFKRVAVMDWSVKVTGPDQFQNVTGAGGRAPLCLNEQRALLGYPPVSGGDAFILPSGASLVDEKGNPLVQAADANPKPSTNVMPPANPNGPAQDGSHRTGDPASPKAATEAEFEASRRAAEEQAILRLKSAQFETDMRRRRNAYTDQIAAILKSHLARQQRAFGAKKALRADSERYNSELAADLLKAYIDILDREGAPQSARLMGTFDPAKVQHWAEDGTKAFASGFNTTTQKHLDEAAAGKSLGDDPTSDIAHVFEVALTARVNEASATAATRLLNFAALAAGQQLDEPGIVRLKYWVPSSADSRHAGLASIGIPLKQAFENGQQYPGDPDGGSEQCAGCQCLLRII